MPTKPRLFLAAALAAAGLATSAGATTNLVTNGDFSAGAAGFNSAYTNQIPTYNAGTYSVAKSPSSVHPAWASFGDHTSGSGNMMIVNGAQTPGVNVWSQDGIAVTANTTYSFSTWIATTYDDAPAMLDFSINGEAIGATFTAGAIVDGWQQFFATWDSGSATSADIALINRNLAWTGNDFALDDIAFWTDATSAAPEAGTWALMIVGFGGAGVMLRRRRSVAATA